MLSVTNIIIVYVTGAAVAAFKVIKTAEKNHENIVT